VVEDWSDKPRELGLALPTTPKEKHAIVRKCKKLKSQHELGKGRGDWSVEPRELWLTLPTTQQTNMQNENLTFRDAAAMVQRKRN
jgi:hypothetical protein